MKLLAGFLLLFISAGLHAQVQYETSVEGDSKILKGIISRNLVEKDSAFTTWYASSAKGFKPFPAAVDALRRNADSIQLLVFMGTWCEDSHFVIPKFYALADAAGLKENKISLVGVDRSKKTLGYLTETLNITNVPTIIVMKQGKEIGRVIEYGKSGLFDKDLSEILTQK